MNPFSRSQVLQVLFVKANITRNQSDEQTTIMQALLSRCIQAHQSPVLLTFVYTTHLQAPLRTQAGTSKLLRAHLGVVGRISCANLKISPKIRSSLVLTRAKIQLKASSS